MRIRWHRVPLMPHRTKGFPVLLDSVGRARRDGGSGGEVAGVLLRGDVRHVHDLWRRVRGDPGLSGGRFLRHPVCGRNPRSPAHRMERRRIDRPSADHVVTRARHRRRHRRSGGARGPRAVRADVRRRGGPIAEPGSGEDGDHRQPDGDRAAGYGGPDARNLHHRDVRDGGIARGGVGQQRADGPLAAKHHLAKEE